MYLKTSISATVGLIIMVIGLFPTSALAEEGGLVRGEVVFIDGNIVGEPQPLAETLETLGRHYGVFFTYDAELVAGREVDFTPAAEETLEMAIDRLLIGTGLGYELFGDKYFELYEDTNVAAGMPTACAVKFVS